MTVSEIQVRGFIVHSIDRPPEPKGDLGESILLQLQQSGK